MIQSVRTSTNAPYELSLEDLDLGPGELAGLLLRSLIRLTLALLRLLLVVPVIKIIMMFYHTERDIMCWT